VSTIQTTSPASLPRGLSGYTALLKNNADVRNVWTAQVISQLGDWFNTVALLGLINSVTDNPLAAGFVTVLTVLPAALMGLTFGGYIADRVDRKTLAIALDIVRAVVACALLLVRSADTLWIAYGVIIVLSMGESIFGAALSAAQPNLCRPHELATANALQQSTWASVSMLGAFAGGVVSQFLGREVAFAFNALSFLISALFLWRVRGAFSQPGQRASVFNLDTLTEGARYLFSRHDVLGISLVKVIWSFVFATAALYSVFAFQVYKQADGGTALLYGARGIGSFLGPVLLQSFYMPKTTRQIFSVVALGLALGIIGYALWGIASVPWLGALALFLGHIGAGNAWTFSRIYVQRETPDALRGRVLAIDSVGFSLIVGGFAAVWSWLAARQSPAIGVLASVVVASVLGLIWLLWMLRQRKTWDTERASAG
jgi:MFS family permease